jgi:hypothetical protein
VHSGILVRKFRGTHCINFYPDRSSVEARINRRLVDYCKVGYTVFFLPLVRFKRRQIPTRDHDECLLLPKCVFWLVY